MITATIQQIIANGNDILVYVLFSNSSNPIVYTFTMLDTQDTINARIQSDLDNMNGIAIQLNNLQILVGTTLSTSPITLQNLNTTINAVNTSQLIQPQV